MNGPLLVVADLPQTGSEAELTGEQLEVARALSDRQNVTAVAPIGTSDDDTVTAFQVVPTTGPTMLEDHFSHIKGKGFIRSPLIWECTRFCIAPHAPRTTASLLLAAAAQLGHGIRLRHAIGVFDHRMARVYKRLGWAPTILGTQNGTSVGLWAFTPERLTDAAARAEVSPRTLSSSFESAFTRLPGERVP